MQRPVGPGDLVIVVAADEDDRTGEIDARRAGRISDGHLPAAVLVAPLGRADLHHVPVDAGGAREGGPQAIGGDHPRRDVGDVVFRPRIRTQRTRISHRADRRRPGLRQEGRQAAPAPGDRRQRADTAQQPSERHPGAGEVDHAEAARPERDLSDRPEHPGGNLPRREQSAGRLPDPPAEPDRRLPDADRPERDLTDGDDPDGDLTDGDDPDRRWTAAGRGVDPPHEVHQRQPADPQPRAVLEGRRRPVLCPRRPFLRSHH